MNVAKPIDRIAGKVRLSGHQLGIFGFLGKLESCSNGVGGAHHHLVVTVHPIIMQIDIASHFFQVGNPIFFAPHLSSPNCYYQICAYNLRKKAL
jgi:hypothetical protein